MLADDSIVSGDQRTEPFHARREPAATASGTGPSGSSLGVVSGANGGRGIVRNEPSSKAEDGTRLDPGTVATIGARREQAGSRSVGRIPTASRRGSSMKMSSSRAAPNRCRRRPDGRMSTLRAAPRTSKGNGGAMVTEAPVHAHGRPGRAPDGSARPALRGVDRLPARRRRAFRRARAARVLRARPESRAPHLAGPGQRYRVGPQRPPFRPAGCPSTEHLPLPRSSLTSMSVAAWRGVARAACGLLATPRARRPDERSASERADACADLKRAQEPTMVHHTEPSFVRTHWYLNAPELKRSVRVVRPNWFVSTRSLGAAPCLAETDSPSPRSAARTAICSNRPRSIV